MTPRKDVEPIESEGVLGGKKFNHPAYGLIGASRVSGDRTLFGTDFVHRNFIVLRVGAATLQRDLSHDWYMPDRMPFVEVALSEAQWATLVSSLNAGQGVPCTLQYAERTERPGIPRRESGVVHEQEFKDRVAALAGHVAKAREAIDAESGLSGKRKAAMLAHLHKLEQDIAQNLPWYTSVLTKQMHDTVEQAKVEVSAYVNATVMRAGLTALADGRAPLSIGPAPEGTDATL